MNSFDARADAGPGRADLCPYGCYWDCEHRAPSSEAAALHPVHDAEGRALRRCRECRQMFYSAVEHAREHERLRQLGLVPSTHARFLLIDDNEL